MRGETYLSLANTELNTVTRSSSRVLTSTPLKLREWKKRRRKSHGYLKPHNLHIASLPVTEQRGIRLTGRRGGGEKEERRRRRVWRGGEDGEKKVRRGGAGEKGGGGVHTAALYVSTKEGGERENGGDNKYE